MSRWVLGIDIGGTNVVVGLVPEEGGAAVGLRSRGTRSMGTADEAVSHIERLVDQVVAEALEPLGQGWDDVVGAGIGCPGPLDLEMGIVLDAFNLGWKDFPLRDRLGEVLGLPVFLDNDANCATYGEFWQGAGAPFSSIVCLTLGTGIGGGIIEDGRLVHGASGTAGEVGHMTIDFTGRRCACGNYGCLEAYASGPNIAARAREGVEAGAETILVELAGGDPENITAVTVSEAVVAGDHYAAGVMLDTARILGVGIANLLNVLNPEAVIIVGGVTRAGDQLFGPLRSEVRLRAFRVASDACRILPGALPDTAGVIGAAGLFLQDRDG